MPANRAEQHGDNDPFTDREPVKKDVPVCTRRPRLGVARLDNIPANAVKADARTRTADPFITSDDNVAEESLHIALLPRSRAGLNSP